MFAMIVIASYTANLAAFLTVETLEKPISSAEDLERQDVIKYGVVNGGSTAKFFQTSANPVYQRMGEFMNSKWTNPNTSNTSVQVFLYSSLLNFLLWQHDMWMHISALFLTKFPFYAVIKSFCHYQVIYFQYEMQKLYLDDFFRVSVTS